MAGKGHSVLTPSQWAEMRAEWESSPHQGLDWLITRGGGRWDVGLETVRRKRAAEGWQKTGTLSRVIEKAYLRADSWPTGDDRKAGRGGVASDPKNAAEAAQRAENAAVENRAKLLERHREEWNIPRALSREAVAKRKTDSKQAFEDAKLAKITSETLKIIQDGERKAWGLDVAPTAAAPGSEGNMIIIERES